MKYGFPWQLLVVFGVLLTLAGCSDSSISSRDVITPTYLFYTTGSTGDYGIYAVDSSDPGNPVTVEAIAVAPVVDQYPYFFIAGTVESGTKTIADLHYRNILYTSDTNFVKVSALKSESLVKQRVSSESFADTICTDFLIGFDDYNDPDQSVYFYSKDPDDAGACNSDGDDILYMIKMGMSSTTAPIGALTDYAPVSATYDSSGAISGFLVRNQTSGNIELRDTSLLNPSATLLGGVTNAFPVAADPSGRIILSINNTDLHIFDPQTGLISASLHTKNVFLNAFPMPIDDTHAYFIDGDVIYRLPIDGSSNSTVVVDESGGAGFLETNMSLSRGRIIYLYNDTAADFVRSVTASGGTGTTIYTLPDTPNVRSFRSAAGRIYISATVTGTPVSLSIGDDGSDPQIVFDAWWSGFTFHPRQKLFADFDLPGRLLGGIGFARMQARVIYQINYASSGNTLTSYDADTTSKLVDFGVPATDFATFDGGGGLIFPPVVNGLANNDQTLIHFDGANSKDVIFLHARNGNSIVRVTNDAVDDNYFGIIGGCTLGTGKFDPVFPLLLILSALYLWHRRHQQKSCAPIR